MYCRSGENKISYLDLVAYAEETGKLYFYCFFYSFHRTFCIRIRSTITCVTSPATHNFHFFVACQYTLCRRWDGHSRCRFRLGDPRSRRGRLYWHFGLYLLRQTTQENAPARRKGRKRNERTVIVVKLPVH